VSCTDLPHVVCTDLPLQRTDCTDCTVSNFFSCLTFQTECDIFSIWTPFDKVNIPLESGRQDGCNGVGFIRFWALSFLSIFQALSGFGIQFRITPPHNKTFWSPKGYLPLKNLGIGHLAFSGSDYISGSKIQWSWDIHFWKNQVTGFSSFMGTCKILLPFLGWISGLSFQQLVFWCPLLLQNVQRVFDIQTCLPFSFFRCGLEPLCRVSFLDDIGFL